MNKRNYQRELDEILKEIQRALSAGESRPELLLHCCCAPCSSYVLEYLVNYFEITLYFYNPNITEEDEYLKRKGELIRYVKERNYDRDYGVKFIDADYNPEVFWELAKGLEDEPERGRRCTKCYKCRIDSTAKVAAEVGADYFCTTLSISPHKDNERLMVLGERAAIEYGIPYLPSDFKKKNGYKRSIELSAEYGLYRQDFCGCVYSKKLKLN